MSGDDAVWASYRRSLRLNSRREATIDTYHWSYRRLAAWSEREPIKLSRADLEGFIEYRLSRVSPITVGNDVRNLKIFYRWAEAEDFIDKSPMRRIHVAAVEHPDKRVFTDAELRAFLRACRGSGYKARRDTAILRLLMEVGSPRIGELASMTVSDVNLATDLVRVDGKTGERYFPIGSRTGRAVELYLRVRAAHRYADTDALWLSQRGALTIWGVDDMLKRRGSQAGIEGRIHAHLWRHTAASRAASAGLADSLMEPLFGWRDGSIMTRLYGRSTRARRAHDAARALGLGDQL